MEFSIFDDLQLYPGYVAGDNHSNNMQIIDRPAMISCNFPAPKDDQIYECFINEGCCVYGCCNKPMFQIYPFWYYWCLILILILAANCSYKYSLRCIDECKVRLSRRRVRNRMAYRNNLPTNHIVLNRRLNNCARNRSNRSERSHSVDARMEGRRSLTTRRSTHLQLESESYDNVLNSYVESLYLDNIPEVPSYHLIPPNKLYGPPPIYSSTDKLQQRVTNLQETNTLNNNPQPPPSLEPPPSFIEALETDRLYTTTRSLTQSLCTNSSSTAISTRKRTSTSTTVCPIHNVTVVTKSEVTTTRYPNDLPISLNSTETALDSVRDTNSTVINALDCSIVQPTQSMSSGNNLVICIDGQNSSEGNDVVQLPIGEIVKDTSSRIKTLGEDGVSTNAGDCVTNVGNVSKGGEPNLNSSSAASFEGNTSDVSGVTSDDAGPNDVNQNTC